ncbi:MAG: IS630 family transposase [Candidatus Entotheonellia bacterium]
MARKSTRPKLVLTAEEVRLLEQRRHSRTAAWREVQRAQTLWLYYRGNNIVTIMKAVKMTRKSVSKWIQKALTMGVAAGLKDTPHGSQPVLTDPAKAWVVHLACSKPKEFGYAAEVWSRQALALHVRRQAVAQGYPSLARASKATVQRILAAQPLQPHKVTYYMERRDPNFESKMRDVLLVYQEVELQNQQQRSSTEPLPKVITVSVDEKPGVQAIANTAPDLPPRPGRHPTLARDHEYERLGTCSILAALDLHTGHVTAHVERRHRSREFITLLKDLDAYYPPDSTIRLVLDNHSSHISKETREFLATRPNRFKYVHTPTHGSWLNIVETLFGKMTRTFLRHIRVQSWQELRDRILQGIAEINAAPVVHRWKKFDALFA